MQRVKDSIYYSEVLKGFNYKFADAFVFDGFLVVEVKNGVNLSWDGNAKQLTDDVSAFIGSNGSNLIYLSNRIYSYSVSPTDWLKFFNQSFSLKAYGVIAYNKIGLFSTTIENLFFHKKINRFNNLQMGIEWAKAQCKSSD